MIPGQVTGATTFPVHSTFYCAYPVTLPVTVPSLGTVPLSFRSLDSVSVPVRSLGVVPMPLRKLR